MSFSGQGDGGAKKGSSSDQKSFTNRVQSASGGSRYDALSGDEKRIICQARYLLESFVLDEAEREHLPRERATIIRTAVREEDEEEGELSPDDQDQLREVALAFRTIGDQVNDKISKDQKISSLINSVAVGSQEEIFKKVCMQMFEDGQINWGRIFVLFYFAYKVIANAVTTTQNCVDWIKRVLKMCVSFFAEYFVWWVIQRGGWKMIIEYWGTSRRTFIALISASVASLLYLYFK